jgi:hypothetical protein
LHFKLLEFQKISDSVKMVVKRIRSPFLFLFLLNLEMVIVLKMFEMKFL